MSRGGCKQKGGGLQGENGWGCLCVYRHMIVVPFIAGFVAIR